MTDRDAFLTMKIVPPEKIRVIGNGIDLTRFDPALVSPEARQAAEAPERREVMGRAGRHDALERFDIRAIVSRVCGAYDELLARKALR